MRDTVNVEFYSTKGVERERERERERGEREGGGDIGNSKISEHRGY